MPFSRIIVLYSILLFSTSGYSLPINLDLTEWPNNTEIDLIMQHNCLYMDGWTSDSKVHEILSYCMSEWPFNWTIEANNPNQTFTFASLADLNTTSEQLYLWSAPLDVIENYQLYLDQRSASYQSSMSAYLYYNCTLPRFGPMCQYSLDIFELSNSSFYDSIFNAYWNRQMMRKNQICYTHLQCNLGPTALCIGWDNICDGIVQCIDGVDEEYCWQLEINECQENEFRCQNGQCIPLKFLEDNANAPDCLDSSDEYILTFSGQPSSTLPYKYEDIACQKQGIVAPGPYLSFCAEFYSAQFRLLIFSDETDSKSDICSSAVKCYLGVLYDKHLSCNDICQNEACQLIIRQNCPDMFYMPKAPVAFGHIYFAYTKSYLAEQQEWMPEPEYICYDEQLCGTIHRNSSSILFNNTICRRPEDLAVSLSFYSPSRWLGMYVRNLYSRLSHCNTILRNDSSFCNKSFMYQCVNSSKCIAKVRLFDGKNDCEYQDDELFTSIEEMNLTVSSVTHLQCTETKRIISRKLVGNHFCDCGEDIYGLCDDEYDSVMNYVREYISFPVMCNGFPDLKPILLNGTNQTDETECELWSCSNIYTRCNGIWNCPDGADEVDCHPSSLMSCPRHSYLCFSNETGDYMCLPLNRINDNIIDCLGAIDELQYCPLKPHDWRPHRFYCDSDCKHSTSLCNDWNECSNGDDEKLCGNIENPSMFQSRDLCESRDDLVLSDVQTFLCNMFPSTLRSRITHFSLGSRSKSSIAVAIGDIDIRLKQYTPSHDEDEDDFCRRGLILRVWLNSEKNDSKLTCICPANCYGDRCQYQNERVNFMARFQVYSDSLQTPFTLIITLIEDSFERTIHSYQQITFIPVLNCHTKYITDLYYSTRPKNQSKRYSIHIDVYEKISLIYRGSLSVPLRFAFLPVERVSSLLNIPHTDDSFKSCFNSDCVHGQCTRYFNNSENATFCRCDPGWTGRYCTIPYNCTCALGSVCLGILSNNRSLCLCPMNKWGSRCLLRNEICLSNQPCQNQGQCVPTDHYSVTNTPFVCICPKDFFGEKCEIHANKLSLSFDQNIVLPQSLFIHFTEVKENDPPEHGTTLKTVPLHQKKITIHWPRPFHIAFIQFYPHEYYLILVQKQYNQSMAREKVITPADRCVHIREVLNETIVHYHLLQRIKYYHVPCQQESPQLSCFYDDNGGGIGDNNTHGYMCLCEDFGSQRQANCFEFDHQKKFDCQGQSNCEHGAQCLQDSTSCPTTSLCVCLPCFYGSRCQYSSRGFSLSLDAILGYHIQPRTSIHHQPVIIRVAVALNILIILVGLTNGILSLITFINKEPRKTGCGFYLMGSSITTFCTMIFFALKFWILLDAQITPKRNRSFLQFQCGSMDFLLQISLNLSQWLNACVAMERAMTAIQGVKFNKNQSKRIAKLVIPAIMIFTTGTLIPDPYYRRLTDDNYNDEDRVWCTVQYPPNVQKLDFIVNIFHFGSPFIVNLASAVIIIIKTARLKNAAKADQSYRKFLYIQIKEHKHLLITPVLLIIFAIPRLIISLSVTCLNTYHDAWLYFIGYVFSFIAPMLVFVIHVVPSKTYTKEFNKSMQTYRHAIQTRIRRQ